MLSSDEQHVVINATIVITMAVFFSPRRLRWNITWF